MPVISTTTKQGRVQKNPSFLNVFYGNLKKIFREPAIKTLNSSGKQGRGMEIGNRQFYNHSDLHPSETALFNVTVRQKWLLVLAGLTLAAAMAANWHLTLEILLALFTLIYFFDSLFNVFLIYRSFTREPEINISKEELQVVPGATWPGYTILCPLYKEWEVVPQFVQAMKNLDYPQDKLQVLLLLEEDDKKTISEIGRFDLPQNFEVIVVPHSMPKTKPKALNYGLRFASGQYTVIYDAEDVPDPLQLKKAVLSFAKSPAGTVCMQAKLNFYNPKQNLLTKVFTAEYSLWFDLVLPGLQSLAAPIPLGGTSNHFRTKDLATLKGWDAFNVTEDCDLGIRLAKRGFKTAIFNSTTWEEANSNYKNWYYQRSRWIKGYMQTFLVHMRQWRMFFQNHKTRDLLSFQMTVGGKVVSIFINPLMWAMTFAYFAFRPTLGRTIESFFPMPILYMGVFSFVFGNFFYLYHYMIGCSKRGFDGLVKYTLLVPFYWLGMSLAAWKALFELIFKPHYWAKTAHGLHLQNNSSQSASFWPPALLKRIWVFAKNQGIVSSGGFLAAAIVLVNFLNFLFNALLGRILTLEEFGVLTLFNTLTILLGVITSALVVTTNYRTSYITAKSGLKSALVFRSMVKNKGFIAAGILSLIWLVMTPILLPFFHIPGLFLGFLFAPIITFGLVSAIDRGFLQGTMNFVFVGVIMAMEAVTKLAAAIILIDLGLRRWVVLSLPVSLGVAFLLSWLLALKVKAAAEKTGAKAGLFRQHSPKEPIYRFPRRFFTAAMLTGLSSMAFLSLDVILAKHFLSPEAAGQYSLLSLAGKMIFYFGSLLGVFIITYTGRSEGAGNNPNPLFYRLLGWALLLVIASWAGLNGLSKFLIPLLFGDKAVSILPYLSIYTAAISMFTIANAFVVFHLTRKHYLFSFVSLLMASMLGFGIWQRHASIFDVAFVLLVTSAIYLAVVSGLHLLQRNGEFIMRNLIDLVDAFFPLAPVKAAAVGGKRILIFNWRDTRHIFAGGAEVYIHELAKRWVQDGSQVTIFCGNDGKNPRNEMVDGVRVIRRGGFYFVYFWAFVYYLLQFRGRFDLIIDCQNGVPFFAPLYAKERVVCLLHHVHQEVFRKYLSWPLAFLASVLENRVMPWAYRHTEFITISDSSKKNLQNLGLGLAGVKIVHPGVDLSLLRPGKKEQQPLILYLGRLKAYKSVDVLIRAFKNVLTKIPQAQLVIAGSGEEEGRLKDLAHELNLQQRVRFTGKISEQEKLSWLQRAWVLVNPSLVEGWGITTIEANACGVPVVAANVPGLCDSVQNPHTGYLVAHGDVNGFSQKILTLLKNPLLREKMGSEAVTWAKKFDWKKISRKGLKMFYG